MGKHDERQIVVASLAISHGCDKKENANHEG